MKIFIDGDASPVIKETEVLAKLYDLDLIIISDKSHNIKSTYATIMQVDTSSDSADFLIFTKLIAGDILVSQDLGLCAMALSKKVHCINQNGDIINEQNVDFLLQNRHISAKLRREKNVYTKFKKRDKAQNLIFSKKLKELIDSLT